MVTPTAVIPRLGELLVARMERWSRAPLADACRGGRGFSDAGPELVDHLLRHRGEVHAWIDALGSAGGDPGWERSPHRFLRARLMHWLRRKNQFFPIDEAVSTEIEASYRRSLLETARVLAAPGPDAATLRGLREILAAHGDRIAALLRSRLGPRPREVISAEYSPALQLAVLGLSPGALADPVLDVGCGEGAALVRLLRARGRRAFGVDLDAPEDVGIASDWLTFPYGCERWGAVVSHLGLSLHFLHAHLQRGPAALAYARAFAAILRSLRVGGVFAYAPALPFIEAVLPATHRVERRPLPREWIGGAARAACDATGLDLGSATQIYRIA